MTNLDAATARIRLTGRQFRQLLDAILHAFPELSSLEQCLFFQLGEHIHQIARSPANLKSQVFDLIRWAESQGRTNDLVRGLRECNSGNPLLKAAAEELFPGEGIRQDDLEKIVVVNPELFSDPDGWRRGMIQSEWTVCRVEKPEGKAWGTGFLIAPELVITNHHVKDHPYGHFNDHPENVRFRFGFREVSDADEGAVFGLEKDWLAHESPSDMLDYAILRVQGKPGSEPIGKFVDAPRRGWLRPKRIEIQPRQALFVLQHPQGDTLKMANGGLRRIEDGWLEYEVNTDYGSSGSPVFNNEWQLVAVHSRYGKTEVNKGIGITAVLNDLPESVRRELA